MFIYVYNKKESRKLFWVDMCDWSNRFKDKICLVVGDFNIILQMNERIGGLFVFYVDVEDFRVCIYDSKFEESKFIGCFFIWINKYQVDQRIFIRLDRVLIIEKWLEEYLYSIYYVFFEVILDYCFLVVNFVLGSIRRKKIFRFFNMWFKNL